MFLSGSFSALFSRKEKVGILTVENNDVDAQMPEMSKDTHGRIVASLFSHTDAEMSKDTPGRIFAAPIFHHTNNSNYVCIIPSKP